MLTGSSINADDVTNMDSIIQDIQYTAGKIMWGSLTLILPAEVIYDSHFFIGKMLQKVLSASLLKKFKFLPMNIQIFFIIEHF